MKLEKFYLEVFIRTVIQGEERAIIQGTQRHPIDQLAKLHLVQMRKDTY